MQHPTPRPVYPTRPGLTMIQVERLIAESEQRLLAEIAASEGRSKAHTDAVVAEHERFGVGISALAIVPTLLAGAMLGWRLAGWMG